MNETFAKLLKVNKAQATLEMRLVFPVLILSMLVFPLILGILGNFLVEFQGIILFVAILGSLSIMVLGMMFYMRKYEELKDKQAQLQSSWEKAYGVGTLPVVYGNDSITFVNEKDGELFAYKLTVEDGVVTLKNAKGEVIEPKAAEVFTGVTVNDPNSVLWEGSTGKEDDRS